ITGKVVSRPDDAVNKNIPTGEIDVEVTELSIYNESAPPPFDINDRNSASEDHRLKYRYLELRTKELQHNIFIRHKAAIATRNFMNDQEFVEIETPVLMKSTPEGARDFLVPSRLHTGRFYALPQSPQTYKQLLMVSGFDKYFQIVKCFRDEDFRADRQPEFTQIDIEMSFVDQDDIINLGTNLTRHIWKIVNDVDLPEEFPVLNYHDAMERYGSDKPDIRFDMELKEMAGFVEQSDFNVFKSVLESGGRVKALICPNAS
ncbi:MAG: aspartate--tRNA ligase, partial [Nitrospinaceae bacterium]|nr:aspartate--tRNA ligase [Nitrospinaceae bacterium]